jgi:cysteinyl-tRNA synthetase
VVAHAFNPSTWEVEAGRFLSSRPAWSTKWVSGQPGLHRETLSEKKKSLKKTTQRKVYFSSQVQVTVHHCREVRVARAQKQLLTLHPHKQAEHWMHLACSQPGSFTLTQSRIL